jgi:hypothetical protein
MQIIPRRHPRASLQRSAQGGRRMPSYRVCFINEIPRDGRLFRCCQRSIVVRSARSPERAVEAAKKRFMRLEGIRDWRIHAAYIESEETDLAAPAGTPAAHQHFHGPRQPLFHVAARNVS